MNDPNTLSKRRQLLAASALVPIIGALSRPTSLQGLIYTLFVCVYLAPFVIKATRKKLNPQTVVDDDGPEVNGTILAESATAQIKQIKQSRRVSTINFVLVLVGSGLVSECLAWVSELFTPNTNPSLIHPQLVADLFIGFFFYFGAAIAWLLLLKRFHFAMQEIFFLSFLVALLKQAKLGTLAGICAALVSDPLTALLTLASLLVVGGSVAGLAFIAGGKADPTVKKLSAPKLLIKYAMSLILVAVLPELAGVGAGLIGRPMGLCPDKKPIWEAPLI